MKQYANHVCNNLVEVQTATDTLDVASQVPLQLIDNGVTKDITNYKGIYNNSSGEFCAAVTQAYNVIQHKEYFDTFAQVLDTLKMKYTMTIKQCGNRAFADIDFKDRNLKFEKLNEEFMTGIRLINGYNGKTGVVVAPRFTRLACTNGMIVTRSEKTLSIKHNTKILSEIQSFVEKKVNEMINQYDELHGWVSEAIKDSKEWKVCCNIIAHIFRQLKHREEVFKRLGISIITVKDKKSKKKSISYVWNDKSKKKAKFTRWEIYNAITSYLTHGEHITPHIEDYYHRKINKLLIMPLNKLPVLEIAKI